MPRICATHLCKSFFARACTSLDGMPSMLRGLCGHSPGKKPLPMLCVWTEKADKSKKCRACIMGNLEQLDAAAQVWTAQAETASFFTALKLSQLRGWKVSKHDVKTAFLNAPVPEDELVVLQPPKIWIEWGLVPANVLWTCDKAIYGLRKSPKWWGEERDRQAVYETSLDRRWS